MAKENTRNYEEQGGATWVMGGDMNVPSGGAITVSSGGKVSMLVTSSTSNDAGIPNNGMCIIMAAAATANDCRVVAAPTRAGLNLHLVANCAATGVNVCVASGTSLVDITIEYSGASHPIWQLGKLSTQKVTLISANTSQWIVTGTTIGGTLSTAGST